MRLFVFPWRIFPLLSLPGLSLLLSFRFGGKGTSQHHRELGPPFGSNRLLLGMRVGATIISVVVATGIVANTSANGQILTRGPVVGGVSDSEAKVFVRTDQESSVVLRYGTDPNLGTFLASAPLDTASISDFTKIIPLAGLSAETTYYLNV